MEWTVYPRCQERWGIWVYNSRLPYEEAKEYKSQIEKEGLALIDFIAPTDPKRRVEKIVKGSKKFIYLVAYAGITGAKQRENLDRIVSDIRELAIHQYM